MTATNERPTQYGLYVRESTEAQLAGVEFNSLQSQESYLQKWVATRGPNAQVFRVYRDVESGTSLNGRDGLMRLVHDAEQGKIQVAVAYEMDRWARNANDYTSLKAKLGSVGVRLESATLRFDDSPEGELMELQMAGFAQYFSRLVGRKVKTKRGEMAAKGMWLGGGVPFGYANNDGKLEVAPAEAAIVRQIFELFARERSASVVRHRLRALGIKNRNHTDWNNTNISYILHNRAYVGDLQHDGKWYRGPQEPLIARELFDAVQAMLPVKRRSTGNTQRPYPLIDILHCGHCGTRLSSHYVDRGNRKVPYYRCTQTFKKTWAACPVKQVNADKIEAKVLNVLDELSMTPQLIAKGVEAANSACSERETALRQEESALKARGAELSKPISNLVEVLKVAGLAALSEVTRELERLTADKALVEHDLRDVQQRLSELRRGHIDVAQAAAVIGDLRLLYQAAKPDERRELMRLVIKRIEYRGPSEPLGFEFFDGGAVNLPREGSKLSNEWLQLKDSNLGPGG